tara:strand:+ start:2722 stop:3318 length:597 start_codon:yes stop_codon:yes gene_type:complete
MKIGIINYDNCNISSIYYAVFNLGFEVEIIENKIDLNKYSSLILPGVGSSPAVMDILKEKDLLIEIKNFVQTNKPILGICVGMHILFSNLKEGKGGKGFCYFKSNIEPIHKDKYTNIGWRDVVCKKDHSYNFLNNNFYFCHSYEIKILPEEEKYVIARDNQTNIISMIKKNNIFGVQFHPEKSQKNGINFLKFFLSEL